MLRAKLVVPPARSRLVERSRLLDTLLAGLSGKLTLISAPAGSGKTTLAGDLARQVKQPVAWLSLDAGDDDPARLMAGLIAAFKLADAGVGAATEALLQSPQPPPLESVMAALLNEIKPSVLILDDYHVIKNETIHHAFAFFIEHLPAGAHLVIASRANPPLPLPRWRGRGELTELRMPDLRFTADEAAVFFNRMMKLELAPESIARLTASAEGWITGLQLAALSLQRREDSDQFIRDFTGRHHYVLDYLMDEVTARQPAEIQAFLLRTSVLSRLTGSLCDALTDVTGGQAALRQIEQANLFLIALDEERQWYRYHHLFAEFLLTAARAALGEVEIAALHSRAARWFERHGYTAEAIEHALAAADHDLAAQLIEQTADDLYSRGAIPTLRRQLEQLPESALTERPRAAIYYAWTLFFSGLGSSDAASVFAQAEDYLRKAEALIGDSPEANEERGMIFAVRTSMSGAASAQKPSQEAGGGLSQTIQYGEQALSNLPERNLTWRSVVNLGLGFAYRLAGDMAAATRAFTEASRLAEAGGNLSGALYALNHGGALLIAQGRLHEAERVYRDGLRLAREHKAEQLPILGQIHFGLGRLLYEWNRLDEAAQCLNKARACCEAGGFPIADVMMALARARHAQGDREAAQAAVSVAMQGGATRGVSATFLAQAEMEQARLKLAAGDVAAAARWAKAANLRPDQPVAPWREAEYLTLARVLIAQGQADQASGLLASLRQAAATSNRTGNLIEILTVEATAQRARGETEAAQDSLKQALALAEPAEYARVFVDEGEPLAALLHQLYQRLKKDHDHQLGFSREYVERLLLALRGEQRASPDPVEANQSLIEPLSERELEILRLIAAGRSNREIAEKLFVAPSTIKWHVGNIYGKLNVRTRTQAIGRAQELGVL